MSDILDRLDAAGKTPYPSVLVVRDAAAEIRRLRSYWTGDKLTGGHDVCWTCAAHCVVIGDLETERDALAAELLRVRGWQVSFLENWEAAELRAVKAENRIIALEAALRAFTPEGIEQVCDDCGGDETKCGKGCPIWDARALLTLAETGTKP